MSSNGPDQKKVFLDPDSNRCSSCKLNQRKIDDVEQNLSGRDQIISLLQNRLKKCEMNYKGLFDDYEKLRFDHCTALQDNYSLKKINQKLEEIELLKSKCNDLKTCGSHHNASNHLDNKRVSLESSSPIIKEVNNIENLVCSQNQILKQLFDRILAELGFCHCDKKDNSKNHNKVRVDFPNIESGDHICTDPTVKLLQSQLESCTTHLEKYKEENECMKKLLKDRKGNCSENFSQQTSKNVNHISTSIDDLKNKTMPKQAKDAACCTEGEVSVILNSREEMCKASVGQIQSELKQKEQEYQICKCQMINQMQDILDNNQILSETLEIMKAENKSNLEAVDKLKEELRRVNEESECKQKQLNARIKELENLLEESQLREKNLRAALEDKNDKTDLTTTEENNDLKNSCCCRCDEGSDSKCKLKNKLDELECTCGEMQKDIGDQEIELNKLDEKNRELNQKIQSLTKENENLRKVVEQFELKQPPENQTSMDKGNSEAGGRCSGVECRDGQTHNLREIETLQLTLKERDAAVEKLTRQNDDLTNQIITNKPREENQADCCDSEVKEMELLMSTLKQRETEIEKLITDNADLRRQLKQRNESNSETDKQTDGSHGHTEEADRCLGDVCRLGQMQKLREIVSLKNMAKNHLEEIKQLKTQNAYLKQFKGTGKQGQCDSGNSDIHFGDVDEAERCLGDDCTRGQEEKLKDIEIFKETVRKQAEKIDKLNAENVDLRHQVERRMKDTDNQPRSHCGKGTDVGDADEADREKKLKEIESLKNIVKEKTETIQQLKDENDGLRLKIERQRSENKKETERLQAMVNHSQQQVELLLKEHDQKTAEIQEVANELDSIRKSINEQNNSFCMQICALEKERDDLKKLVEEYESHKSKCKENSALEDQLKAEIYKKQQVILELEKTIDSCNHNMKQFEMQIETLACENACLKSENEQHLKDVQDIRIKLGAKVFELEKMQEQLIILHRDCNRRSRDRLSLANENEKLNSELDKLAREQERAGNALECQKLDHQTELARLKDEHSTKIAALLEKLENCQKAAEKIRNECAKKCNENNKLLDDLDKNKKVTQELEKENENLQRQCGKFKNECRASMEDKFKLGEKMTCLQECADKLTRQYTNKCMENDELQETINEDKKNQSKMAKKCEALCNKLTENENALTDVNEKYNNVQKEFDEKCNELKKVKKQWESSCKQSEISRDEYNNLRKAYKEIKVMLSDQIKKYKKDTDTVNADEMKPNTCKILNELKTELVEKDQQIMVLQEKLKDSSYEIIELKDYIHKLISDNNILKSAINNLIGNLERKIKGSSGRPLINDSADSIAGEILQSLTCIENSINKKPPQGRYCTTGCAGKDCDCLSKINSQYPNKPSEPDRATDADVSGYCSEFIFGNSKPSSKPSKIGNKVPSKDSGVMQKAKSCAACFQIANKTPADGSLECCKIICEKKASSANPSYQSRDKANLSTVASVADKGYCEEEETIDASKPTKLDSNSCCSGDSLPCGSSCEVNKLVKSRSDVSTSESDDHCCDQMSVELLKETIEGLSGSKNKIMKNKSTES